MVEGLAAARQRPIAVIGGGYAGFAAAVELAAAGVAVEVFEASRSLGGRARGVDIDGVRLDNGQHILVGAYRETLRLMRRVGAAPERCLQRLPLLLELPGRLRIAAPDWPAPLHLAAALIGAQGLSAGEKWAAVRFMLGLKLTRYRLQNDISVAALIATQPLPLRRYLWEPLCIATLNTPPDEASAQVFLNVLRDTLGAGRKDSDLLLPCVDLSRMFPEPAAEFVAGHGGQIVRGSRITQLEKGDDGWSLRAGEARHGPYRQLILAVAPQHATALLPSAPACKALRETLAALRYQPIVTVWLQYPPQVRLAAPMLGAGDGLLQWLFDRGQLGGPPGLLAAVISAEGRHQPLDHDELASRLHAEAARIVPQLPSPLWHRVIVEQRATFACLPGMRRPPLQTPLPGLLLAGDYVASDYPATLEGAVRSGVAAAGAVLAGND
ncbi:MAG: hydroxysqualene dehydroxylase HpnE [Rhodocyclaceae bacterium]|nr:hydroxysqualene dehydroxylase HpnE [Rhodocyclaceae bacterium]